MMPDFTLKDVSSKVRSDLELLDMMADWMDSRFTIPGTSIRFCLDSLLGFIPGIGDTIGLAVAGYVVRIAYRYQLPWHLKLKMIWNIFLDWLTGLIPFFGDIFDIGFKANRKNVALLKGYLEKTNMVL